MSTSSPDSPIINEEADRLLGRIILRYGGLAFLLLLLATVGMAFVNIPQSRLYPIHRLLDTISVLVILLPFFVGINRLFEARLRLGREFVEKQAWREAVAALDPFAGPGQRFLDRTGEAHFLLAQAYDSLGDRARANSTRAFLRRHRAGVWAERAIAPPLAQGIINRQEKRPGLANGKRRRRF